MKNPFGNRTGDDSKVAEYALKLLEEQLAADAGGPLPPDGLPRRSPEDLVALAKAQGVKPVARFEDLLGDFWPEEENVDDFIAARRQWQWEGQSDAPESREP